MEYAILIISIFMIAISMMLDAVNNLSKFFLKVFPFFSGLFLLLYSLNSIGWLSFSVGN